MTERLRTPRTIEYHLLRICERFHLSPEQMDQFPYELQIRLLAYHRLRLHEESGFSP